MPCRRARSNPGGGLFSRILESPPSLLFSGGIEDAAHHLDGGLFGVAGNNEYRHARSIYYGHRQPFDRVHKEFAQRNTMSIVQNTMCRHAAIERSAFLYDILMAVARLTANPLRSS